ncbi:1200_t:CDS:2, partial [Racocetra fulgida]
MEDKKKRMRMASGEGEYVTKIEFFQELKEIRNLVKDEYSQIKKDIKEVKKAVITPNQKADAKITELEVQKDKLTAQLNDEGDEIYFPDIDEVLGIEKPLKKHKPAHIHVRGTKYGKIQFWLEKTDAKSKDEVKVKKIKGRVSEEEQNE